MYTCCVATDFHYKDPEVDGLGIWFAFSITVNELLFLLEMTER